MEKDNLKDTVPNSEIIEGHCQLAMDSVSI
jgi:hypothetical protein